MNLVGRPTLLGSSEGAPQQGTVMGYTLLMIAMTLNATANVLLKLGAARMGDISGAGALLRLATNGYLIGGILLFAANIGFYAAALARLDLSLAYPVMIAGGVVIVAAASAIFLNETLGASRIAGLVLLVAGIALAARAPGA